MTLIRQPTPNAEVVRLAAQSVLDSTKPGDPRRVVARDAIMAAHRISFYDDLTQEAVDDWLAKLSALAPEVQARAPRRLSHWGGDYIVGWTVAFLLATAGGLYLGLRMAPSTAPAPSAPPATIRSGLLQSLGASLMECSSRRSWDSSTAWAEIRAQRDLQGDEAAACVLRAALLACGEGTAWPGFDKYSGGQCSGVDEKLFRTAKTADEVRRENEW